MSLNGVFAPPGDKSISHRMALFSILAKGACKLTNFSPCADVRSSLDAVKLLGIRADANGDALIVEGAGGTIRNKARIDCGNSGTTMRLLMGILAGRPGEFVLDGDESLRRRPMERVAIPLRMMGAQIDCPNGKSPVHIRGAALQGIAYELPVASAQLKSAILLAGVQADRPTLVGEPAASRDHTEKLLRLCGGEINGDMGTWYVGRSELVLPDSFYVPGDISSAAFFLCAAAITPGSTVEAHGVLQNPTRTGFIDVLDRMGADIDFENWDNSAEPYGMIRTRFTPGMKGCRIRAEEIPLLVDEVPILALVATQANGTTAFEGVGELRIKESDRLAAVASQLGAMGAEIQAEGDTLVVEGPTRLKCPNQLDSFGDHRIAMTLRLAAFMVGADPHIEGEESTSVSYPGFHETLNELAR